MKQALISLLVITGLFTSLNGGVLTKGAQNAKAIPAKAPAKTRVDQGQPKVGTLKPADFGKFRDSAKGKVLVLNFWATWCGPCVAEFPELVALDAKYRDKGMKLVGITADDPDDVQPKVIPFIKKHPGEVRHHPAGHRRPGRDDESNHQRLERRDTRHVRL